MAKCQFEHLKLPLTVLPLTTTVMVAEGDELEAELHRKISEIFKAHRSIERLNIMEHMEGILVSLRENFPIMSFLDFKKAFDEDVFDHFVEELFVLNSEEVLDYAFASRVRAHLEALNVTLRDDRLYALFELLHTVQCTYMSLQHEDGRNLIVDFVKHVNKTV